MYIYYKEILIYEYYNFIGAVCASSKNVFLNLFHVPLFISNNIIMYVGTCVLFKLKDHLSANLPSNRIIIRIYMWL